MVLYINFRYFYPFTLLILRKSGANVENSQEKVDNQLQLLLGDTSEMELRPDLGLPTPVGEKHVPTPQQRIDAKNQRLPTTLENTQISKISHSDNNDVENSAISNKSSSSMKVSLALFSNKKKRKQELHTTKNKAKRNDLDTLEYDGGDIMVSDTSIDEISAKDKERKNEYKKCDPDDGDLNLSSSKLAQTKTTYARSRRPFSNSPASSIHSPAPYRTPSYSPAAFSLPSPFSPFPATPQSTGMIDQEQPTDIR